MATGAAGSPPQTAPTNPPPARLGANAAATRLTRPAPPASALDPDEWLVPRDCPAITSLNYLGWRPPATGASAPLTVSEVQGVCISACTFDLSDGDVLRSLRGANLVEHLLSLASCSSVLHELHDARIFNTTYESEAEFVNAVQGSPLVNKAALLFSPTWIELSDPFDSPAVAGTAAAAARRSAPAARAVPAAPARPGPVELKFLQLTTWASVLSEASRLLHSQESRALARTVSLLSHRMRDAARRDDTSELRSVSSTLATYVSAWAGLGKDATPPQLARHTAPYLVNCMSIMPVDLAGPGGTAVSCEAELRDGHTLLRGRESEAATMLWTRIHCNLNRASLWWTSFTAASTAVAPPRTC